jgi:trans-aconitate 2-methyltransferase
MRSLATEDRWAPLLDGVLRHHETVSSPAEYATLLLDAGLSVDVWETTYLHMLLGRDPVLEWLRGTGLRPVLAALSAKDGREFSAEFGQRLRVAYPAAEHGTPMPFRRLFAVAHRA